MVISPAGWRRMVSGMAVVGLTLLSGCLPAPSAHEVLQIDAAGRYRLQGHPVERERLQQQLVSDQGQIGTLLVELHPAPEADMAAVLFAVDAVRAARGRVAFTRDASLRGAPSVVSPGADSPAEP